MLYIKADGGNLVNGGGDKVIRICDYDQRFVDMECEGYFESLIIFKYCLNTIFFIMFFF